MRWLALGLVLFACADTPPVVLTRAAELRALSPAGEPVPHLRAWLDGVLLGETKSDGTLSATLRGRPHQRLLLSWACPATHEPPTGQRDIALDPQATDRDARAAASAPLKLEARCAPLEVATALVVRALGAPREGVPVRVRDEVVARTNEDGIAHVLLRARRGSMLTVALDTSAHPKLMPASPVETFQLGDEDTILLLDRTLKAPPLKPKRHALNGAKDPRQHIPVRIQ